MGHVSIQKRSVLENARVQLESTVRVALSGEVSKRGACWQKKKTKPGPVVVSYNLARSANSIRVIDPRNIRVGRGLGKPDQVGLGSTHSTFIIYNK